MRLRPEAVRRLVQQERDRLELRRFKLDSIPVELARALLEREMAREPDLTRAEVAQRMQMQQADFDRQFGYTAGKSGKPQERVGIPAASRLAIALGRAPNELEGC